MKNTVIIADALRDIGKKLEVISDILSGSGYPQLLDAAAASEVVSANMEKTAAQAPIPATASAPADTTKLGKSGIYPDGGPGASTAVSVEPIVYEVRELMKRLCKQGLTEKVQAVISHYGVNALRDIDPRFYSDLLAEAMALEANSTNNNDNNTEAHHNE